MDGEHRVVTAQLAGGEVGRQLQRPDALLAADTGTSAEVTPEQGTGGGVVEVVARRRRDEKPACDVLHVLQGRVVAVREVRLGDVHRECVGHEDAYLVRTP